MVWVWYSWADLGSILCVCLVYSHLGVSEGCGSDLVICIRNHGSIHASGIQEISGLHVDFHQMSSFSLISRALCLFHHHQVTLWYRFTVIQILVFKYTLYWVTCYIKKAFPLKCPGEWILAVVFNLVTMTTVKNSKQTFYALPLCLYPSWSACSH